MPVYEYQSAGGATVLLRRPVDLRDAPVLVLGHRFRRRTVPSRITVGVGAVPESMGARLTKGYRSLELAQKLSDKNPNYLPVKTIKAALARPDPKD